MRIDGIVLCVAVALALGGCTSGGTEEPLPPTASATPSAAATLDPDVVFSAGGSPVWREHPGPGDGPFANEDTSVQAGSYRLQVACLGGALSVAINATSTSKVDCSSQPESIPVCLHKAGLRVSAQWVGGSVGDMVWQLVRRQGTC